MVDLPKACQTTFTVAQNAEVGARNLMDSTQVRQKPSCVCLLVIAARSDNQFLAPSEMKRSGALAYHHFPASSDLYIIMLKQTHLGDNDGELPSALPSASMVLKRLTAVGREVFSKDLRQIEHHQ